MIELTFCLGMVLGSVLSIAAVCTAIFVIKTLYVRDEIFTMGELPLQDAPEAQTSNGKDPADKVREMLENAENN